MARRIDNQLRFNPNINHKTKFSFVANKKPPRAGKPHYPLVPPGGHGNSWHAALPAPPLSGIDFNSCSSLGHAIPITDFSGNMLPRKTAANISPKTIIEFLLKRVWQLPIFRSQFRHFIKV